MSAFDRVREMAVSYPESNPFDMHPPLHNLRPESAQDPPVLENTLLEIAQAEGSRGHNLFHRMLGDCPLLFGSTALPPDSPLPDGGELTPLHKISAAKFKFRIVKSLTHHRILKSDAYDGPLVFQIKVGEEMRVLKVVRSKTRLLRLGRSSLTVSRAGTTAERRDKRRRIDTCGAFWQRT